MTKEEKHFEEKIWQHTRLCSVIILTTLPDSLSILSYG
jgi:hypothetical protein